jgi:hypothetical protein
MVSIVISPRHAAPAEERSRSQPPVRDLRLGEVAKGVRAVVVHLQWLFLVTCDMGCYANYSLGSLISDWR